MTCRCSTHSSCHDGTPSRPSYRLFGLITYTTETERHPDEWDKRFTIFPFVFYRYSHLRGTQLSVLPFYVDVEDFFGYQRVQMILFPLYLRLEEALTTRTWVLFPFVSWSGGTFGRGYRIWPVVRMEPGRRNGALPVRPVAVLHLP